MNKNTLENSKKNNKIIIIIIAIVVFLILGFVVYNFFIKSNSNSSNNEVKMDKEKQVLYDSLITSSGYYGFYLGEDLNINDISEDYLLTMVIEDYIKENNLEVGYNAFGDCNIPDLDPDFSCEDWYNHASIAKDVIDTYIKNRFNSTRNFEIKKINDQRYATISLGGIPTGVITYDFENKKYAYGYASSGGEVRKIYRKISKIEESNDELYFYDNAFLCEVFDEYICYTKNDKKLFDASSEKLAIDDDLPVITDSIFEKYKDSITTYKHTFKKVNDKYYWYSSTIIK